MRLLLDTHTLVWSALDPTSLSATARELIEDGRNEVFVSAVSAMEIATKVRKGTFETARPLARRFAVQMAACGFSSLAITADHGERAGGLELDHRDPWDRLLIAQSQIEDLVLVTCDKDIRRSATATIW